jgi:hypothetical protein
MFSLVRNGALLAVFVPGTRTRNDSRHPTAAFFGASKSAELLGQRDDDALGAAHVAEPITVLVLHHLANEL